MEMETETTSFNRHNGLMKSHNHYLRFRPRFLQSIPVTLKIPSEYSYWWNERVKTSTNNYTEFFVFLEIDLIWSDE